MHLTVLLFDLFNFIFTLLGIQVDVLLLDELLQFLDLLTVHVDTHLVGSCDQIWVDVVHFHLLLHVISLQVVFILLVFILLVVVLDLFSVLVDISSSSCQLLLKL